MPALQLSDIMTHGKTKQIQLSNLSSQE